MTVFAGRRIGPLPRALVRPLRWLRSQLPPLNFITIHYAYFIGTCLLSAVIFWGSSTPARSVSFTDSLFLTVSAMTLAGLNTINLSILNTFQQFILFLLIMLGSAIFVSAFVVHIRRNAFEKKFSDILAEQKTNRSRGRSMSQPGFDLSSSVPRRQMQLQIEKQSDIVPEDTTPTNADVVPLHGDQTHKSGAADERDLTPPARRGGPGMNGTKHGGTYDGSAVEDDVESSDDVGGTSNRIGFSPETNFTSSRTAGPSPSTAKRRGSIFSMQGVGANPLSSLRSAFPQSGTLSNGESPRPSGRPIDKLLPFEGYVGRNGQFHGLTEADREALGGCEYRAIHVLSWMVPLYFVLWQLLGCLGLAAYVAYNRPDTALTNGLNPWWVGAFNSVSAFNNSGMSLLDANMVAFQTSYYMLITMSLLILAGNTCYPIFLRLIIWTLWKLLGGTKEENHLDPHDVGKDRWKDYKMTLRFLMDHPRRCYTNLFPSQHTWWLLIAVISLNGVDWAFFEILGIGNTAIDIPTRYKVIDGLFQAFAVRSGGFYVVPISSLRIALQVLYVIMMYISVYPVVITMRNSNVYEE
ncbi:hypothetical protein LTR66_012464, partial [Elasticomyces elasticus]